MKLGRSGEADLLGCFFLMLPLQLLQAAAFWRNPLFASGDSPRGDEFKVCRLNGDCSAYDDIDMFTPSWASRPSFSEHILQSESNQIF